ncbi:DNA polymerase III subunit delta' [Vibrio sp. SCSIO 43135]|uniref:DNA polymerase III subunit delta' n=1 Tax=Vibrio sp. SCSIO 43135 TaxID=2819096 RepID=UPI00207641EB|nr:DNA polymerase III subunit delta' [Vibrio sp. SCSIO 43135]USD41979.1 DNA polymerase III subunit delta' [Vibrio sp. SCSIO 43135]
MQALYPWLSPVWQQWKDNLDQKRFSNATLVCAPKGLGVGELVDKACSALMCQNYESEPCGFCHSCELMNSGSHPDFHKVSPEKEGKAITVDQIRTCNRMAQESSQLGGFRVIVIEPAQAMNESAANALLKTLETPSSNCIFILVAPRASMLLPTIVSRCQQWVVATPTSESVSAWLSEHTSKAVPAYAAHIHGNAPLTALSFIEDKGDELYSKVESQLLSVARNDWTQRIELSQLLASQDDECLSWVWYLLVDAQKYHFGLNEACFTPGAQALSELLSYDILYKQANSLRALQEQLRTHSGLNRELLLMNWLIELSGETCS